MRGEALKELLQIDLDIWEDEQAHVDAKRIVKTILQAEDLGNGFRFYYGKDYSGVTDGEHRVHLLDSPSLSSAKTVIALDAFPILFGENDRPLWWRARLGIEPEVAIPLSKDEPRRYITKTLSVKVIQTTEHIKPYSSGNPNFIADSKDPKLIKEVSKRHEDSKITAITPAQAIPVLESDSLPVKDWVNYANVHSNNEFAKEDVGIIIGSTHYGDSIIKQIGAFMQKNIESNGEKGTEKGYGHIGDEILRGMREYPVAQAILRFGRDKSIDETTVYVHTAAIPEEIPIYGTETSLLSCKMQVLEYLQSDEQEEETATPSEITEHITCSRRSVYDALDELKKEGDVICEKEASGPNGAEWKIRQY